MQLCRKRVARDAQHSRHPKGMPRSLQYEEAQGGSTLRWQAALRSAESRWAAVSLSPQPRRLYTLLSTGSNSPVLRRIVNTRRNAVSTLGHATPHEGGTRGHSGMHGY